MWIFAYVLHIQGNMHPHMYYRIFILYIYMNNFAINSNKLLFQI